MEKTVYDFGFLLYTPAMQEALLVMETSCLRHSAAAWIGESLVCREEWKAERNHASAIFEPLKKVLHSVEGCRLTDIVAGSGPGSYGGIRVALAVADGLSLVHGSRVAAFSSWNGLGIREDEAWVMSDARRGGWAIGKLIHGLLEGDLEILPGEQARDRVQEYLNAGRTVYSTETEDALRTKGMNGVHAILPDAEFLGRTWMSLAPEKRLDLSARPAEPLYVRAPHITCSKRPAWAVRA